MKNRQLWMLSSLLFLGSAAAHAAGRVPTLLADLTVPEPSSTMFGAAALLVVLGLARRRQAK